MRRRPRETFKSSHLAGHPSIHPSYQPARHQPTQRLLQSGMFEMRPGSLAVTLGMLTRISNERSENPDPVESICTTWEEDEIEDQRIHLRREGEGDPSIRMQKSSQLSRCLRYAGLLRAKVLLALHAYFRS